MNTYMAVYIDDIPAVSDLDLPLPVAVVQDAKGKPIVSLSDARLPDHRLYPDLLLGVALSKSGLKALERLGAYVAAQFSCAPPPVADLTASNAERDGPEIALAVARELTAELQRQAERNVALTRSLAALRDTHARTQAAFDRLERFVLDNDLAGRTEHFALLPSAETGAIVLNGEADIEQRLPTASPGLSDIELFIEEVESPEGGILTVTLSTSEDGVTRGHWEVAGHALAGGRIRLSLPVSLETEVLTPVLTISWAGEGFVRVPTALFHPDPRFQAHLAGLPDGRVLACRCWTYVPGCEASIPADAILPSATDAKVARTRLLDRRLLETAVNLTPGNDHFRYLEDADALMVHAPTSGVSVGMIPGVALKGATHIKAQVCTRSDQAPAVDYALAIAPVTVRPEPDDSLPEFEPGHQAPWISLDALELGEIHLPLNGPLSEPHDLYLMTRLAGGAGDASWGWSTFGKIKITLE